MYRDKAGKPITLEEWAMLIGDEDYRRIGSDHVDAAWVSTVWVGIDQAGGPYETMVFGLGFEDNPCIRYHTEGQAIAGHRQAVEELQTGRVPSWM